MIVSGLIVILALGPMGQLGPPTGPSPTPVAASEPEAASSPAPPPAPPPASSPPATQSTESPSDAQPTTTGAPSETDPAGGPSTTSTGSIPAWVSPALAIGGFFIIGVIMVNNHRKRFVRDRAGGDPSPAARLAALKRRAGQRDDLDTLIVDVQELTQRCAAQIDNRVAYLETLIADADRRIERLTGLNPGSATGSPTGIGQDQGAVGAGLGAGVGARGGVGGGGDLLYREVVRLAGEGLDAVAIARELDEHVGKIELILALRRASA